ncbi:hypothetical protein [Nesterenkonia sp. CF4.4]|uniref:hypothetical protein n=1 Tax=Nesterenkonia sp. CF4.4 TaxID=3373079 RepID=UPI003EE54840
MIDFLNGLLGDVRNLITTALVVIGLVIAILGSVRKPTITGIITACIGGALVAAIGVIVVNFSGLFEAELGLIIF